MVGSETNLDREYIFASYICAARDAFLMTIQSWNCYWSSYN